MKKTKTDKILKVIAIILALGLLVFELLNYLDILKLEVTFTWLGLIVTIALVVIGVEIFNYALEKTINISFSSRAFLIVVIAIYIDALSDIFSFYTRWIWFDQVMHFLSGCLIALIVLLVLQKIVKAKKIILGKFGQGLFTWTIALSIGSFYEMVEYTEDYLTGSNRLGDGFDTVNDLFLGGLGALIVIFIFFIIKKNATRN